MDFGVVAASPSPGAVSGAAPGVWDLGFGMMLCMVCVPSVGRDVVVCPSRWAGNAAGAILDFWAGARVRSSHFRAHFIPDPEIRADGRKNPRP